MIMHRDCAIKEVGGSEKMRRGIKKNRQDRSRSFLIDGDMNNSRRWEGIRKDQLTKPAVSTRWNTPAANERLAKSSILRLK